MTRIKLRSNPVRATYAEGYKAGLSKGRSLDVAAQISMQNVLKVENLSDILKHKMVQVIVTRVGRDSFNVSIPGVPFEGIDTYTIFEGAQLTIQVPVHIEITT